VRPGPGVTGRLAPTPSGHLHLGNVTAFTAAWLSARVASGRLLLRFEDLDLPRARPDVEESQRHDLAWLGLGTDAETTRQSERTYDDALACLAPLTYRCTCTRAAVRAAGGRYPGTCRSAGHTTGALRLRLPDAVVRVHDRRLGDLHVDLRALGDPVLVRADGVVGYTLAVVVDDIRDGIDEVVRGADLAEQAAVHEVLWRALAGRVPTWLHAPLVLGPDGRKLSKSHGATELRALQAAGWTPDDVRAVVLPWLGLPGHLDLDEAARRFDPTAGPRGPVVLPAPLTPPVAAPPPPR
jgi:glutamyl/glutaminyl-tRNA synthetase